MMFCCGYSMCLLMYLSCAPSLYFYNTCFSYNINRTRILPWVTLFHFAFDGNPSFVFKSSQLRTTPSFTSLDSMIWGRPTSPRVCLASSWNKCLIVRRWVCFGERGSISGSCYPEKR